MEELNKIYDQCKLKMELTITHLSAELTKIRAGKAAPSMLDKVVVDYYGVKSPLNQVSNILTPDARTITVQAWDKSLLVDIEKAIINENLGLNPQNNGDMIIIHVPPLTEQRRISLVKQIKVEGEHTKISIRNTRKESNDEVRKLKNSGLSEDIIKDAEEKIQSFTTKFIDKINILVEKKEADIMKI